LEPIKSVFLENSFPNRSFPPFPSPYYNLLQLINCFCVKKLTYLYIVFHSYSVKLYFVKSNIGFLIILSFKYFH